MGSVDLGATWSERIPSRIIRKKPLCLPGPAVLKRKSEPNREGAQKEPLEPRLSPAVRARATDLTRGVFAFHGYGSPPVRSVCARFGASDYGCEHIDQEFAISNLTQQRQRTGLPPCHPRSCCRACPPPKEHT